MKKLVKLVKLNNLEYNVNRDPAVYRRNPNETFRVQALIDGVGKIECSLTDAAGKILNHQSVTGPCTYTHEISFATPGVRVATLNVAGVGERFVRDLLLDVMAHPWQG